MRQLQASCFGPPQDVLAVVDTDDPPLAAGEVRLACHAVGLNFLDVMLCRGEYPGQQSPPVTPGVEAVGQVVEVAPGVPMMVGQTVLACPTMPAGALGERVAVSAALTVPVPPGGDSVQLAALPVTYQTAWFALRRARLAEGDTVLVHGGAGGVGTAVTQLATAWGARVIATAGGADKVSVCLKQGAAAAIDYLTDDFTRAVAEFTNGRGVDVVIDPVGGAVFSRSLGCLALEGRIVPVGAAGGRPQPVDPLALSAANVSVVGLSWGSAYPYERPAEVRAAYAELLAMLGSQVRPVIDRVIGLEDVPAALADLEARRTIGKIVVRLEGVCHDR
jgi:NADPH:quinone reductase